MIFLSCKVFSTGLVLFVLKSATVMLIVLIKKYVSMASARRVVEMIISVKEQLNATRIHALLPVKWETPVYQLNTAILTTIFASQSAHQTHIVMLDTHVPEDIVSSLVQN